MKSAVKFFSLLSDETRFRILMLLTMKELCVCQIMGVLGVSQPLISRNLSLLKDAGLLDERRDGKLVFYSLKRDLEADRAGMLDILRRKLEKDEEFRRDLESLADCTAYQKKTGRCDMKTFLAYMEEKRRTRKADAAQDNAQQRA
ncbi:MAG TPA: metalloregulator ArsR/SmtB family transcription factor [Dissulfurispiraceae bacterium]|nr:metalloregulator ArsR/SmtB family transcription factor [Dissulfurispiraceae bacterium]